MAEESSDVKYRIRIQTGNLWNAGTSAQVYIELIGDKGRTGRADLENRGFAQDGIDVYFVVLKDVGDIAEIAIGHDNTGWGASWYLENVVVSTKSPRRKVYTFDARKWLSGPNDLNLVLTARDITGPTLATEDGGDYENIYKEIWGEKLWKSRGGEHEFKPSHEDASLASRVGLTAIVDGFVSMLFVQHYYKGERGTHVQGLGASGTITLYDDLNIPPNSFFKPGQKFSARARHANSGVFDDRQTGTKGLSLKFSNEKHTSPFDLTMNTGKFCGFWGFPTSFKRFTDLLSATRRDAARMQNTPTSIAAAITGYRLGANSFTDLRYYAQMTYHFTADKSDKKDLYYARFRIVPDDDRKETGLMNMEEQYEVCYQAQFKDTDTKPSNYIRKEFREIFKKGEVVKYRLEIQLRPRTEGDHDAKVYNIAAPWPESEFPYVKLGLIELNKLLDDEDAETTTFRLDNIPHNVLSFSDKYTGFDEFNSIIWVRNQIYGPLQKIRLSTHALNPNATKNNH